MIGSGLRIFNAYPAFARRGETFCCYPFEGHPIPSWLTFGGWLAGARHWHFAAMWVLVANGLVYLGFIYLHGEWRDLVPRRGRAARRLGRWSGSTWRCAGSTRARASTTRSSGWRTSRCRSSAMLAVLSGLAIWKPVQLAPLTGLLGGYVWARYWHFLAMLLAGGADPRSRLHGVRGRSVLAAIDRHRWIQRRAVARAAQRASVREPARAARRRRRGPGARAGARAPANGRLRRPRTEPDEEGKA